MKTALLVGVTLLALVGGGVGLSKISYDRGVTAGVEQGRYQQQNYIGVMNMAVSCYALGKVYDETPAEEKLAKGHPVKWDYAATCDRLKATANSYLGKPAKAEPEAYIAKMD